MESFCSNQKCEYHKIEVPMSVDRINVKASRSPTDFTTKNIIRHLYRARQGTDFMLCEVCHNAVEMCK